MHAYFKKLHTWLLPYYCILCNKQSTRLQDLCEECHRKFPLLGQACQCCARPLIMTQPLCGQCLHRPPPFESVYANYLYQGPITQLILELKFNQALVNAQVLGELMIIAIQEKWYLNQPLPQVIVPVPLHPARLKERGFNQAMEIARPIAAAIKRPINVHGCRRVKSTPPQATLAAHLRQHNIKQAFTVTADFSGQHIAVIDDVITTGSTLTEFCKTLKMSGAKKIDVWCCARSVFS